MKIIVAGGRDFVPTNEHKNWLISKLRENNCTLVISGCARGADTFGEIVANELKIPISKFTANWNLYGKSAGYKRNVQMAENADCVILFPGGNGTQHMYNIACELGLKVIKYDN